MTAKSRWKEREQNETGKDYMNGSSNTKGWITKLMIIRKINGHGEFIGEEEVAVDYVGAGIGETVLIGQGSSVRVDEKKRQAVIDMAIIGIVDNIDI